MFGWIGLLLGLIGLWLAGRRNYGWLIAALSSIPWLIYAIPSALWALVATTTIYGLIDMRNYIVGRKNGAIIRGDRSSY